MSITFKLYLTLAVTAIHFTISPTAIAEPHEHLEKCNDITCDESCYLTYNEERVLEGLMGSCKNEHDEGSGCYCEFIADSENVELQLFKSKPVSPDKKKHCDEHLCTHNCKKRFFFSWTEDSTAMCDYIDDDDCYCFILDHNLSRTFHRPLYGYNNVDYDE